MAHALLSQDGFQRGGFWEVGRTYGLASPFDLSRILPVGGGLLVPCSLPGPPVIKQLMRMVTSPGWAVSVSGSLNKATSSISPFIDCLLVFWIILKLTMRILKKKIRHLFSLTQ